MGFSTFANLGVQVVGMGFWRDLMAPCARPWSLNVQWHGRKW